MRKVVSNSVEPLYFTLFLTIIKKIVSEFSYYELIFNVVSTHINDTYSNFFEDKGVEFFYSREFFEDGVKVDLLFEFFCIDTGYREIYRIKSPDDYIRIFNGFVV